MASRLTLQETALAVAVAASAAVLAGLVLAWVSAPANFKGRIAAVEEQSGQVRALVRPAPHDGAFPSDAICHRDPAAAAKTLRDGVTAAATQNNLNLDMLDARPDMPVNGGPGVAAVRVRFTTTGSYEGTVALLATLSRQRPALFADTVDLVSKTSNVSFTFSGRAFCAA